MNFIRAGGGLSSSAAGYNFRTELALQDPFVGGVTTSGSIGLLAWSSAGSISAVSSTTNHIGVFRISTTAVQGTQGRISWAQNSVVIDPTLNIDQTWLVMANNFDADTVIRVGLSNAVQNDPPTDGIYFEKVLADTNWFIVTRAGGVQTGTRADSGVAISAAWVFLRIQKTASGVQFSINGTNVGSVLSANIPTAFINPMVSILNNAAAAKTIDVDHFKLYATGLTL